MRIRTGLGLLAGCCAALAACTAAPPTGPNATVTRPAIGRPPAPASAQAALSSEAFTPYAGLGAVANDGLAPGDTYDALHTACMNAAGSGQYASMSPYAVRANRGLAFPQAWGPWGYIGVSVAAQVGFGSPSAGPGANSGPGSSGPASPLASLPAAAQAAAGKCLNIVMDFNDAMFATALAGIETMNNDISTDVIQDPDFKKATKAWSACMAKNGYTTSDADTFALNELVALGLRASPGSGPTTTSTQKESIAMAVTDAQCTLSSDLAGIYFAVQASYEQQFVTANQQALNVAVRQYKAAFAKELAKLPALLRTVSATPNLPGPRRPGQPGHPGKPTATPSRSAG